MVKKQQAEDTDIVLIGAGIMSATLAVLLKTLDSSLKITIIERLDVVAGESTDAWNNAGTGHSALCELNYTPQSPDGSIDIKKAVQIFGAFEESRQFWSWLVQEGILPDPTVFIRPVAHMSFVQGEDNVAYLRKRFETMHKMPFFSNMVFSDDHNVLNNWIPLVMQGRDHAEKVAATSVETGTDVNFGALSRKIFEWLWIKQGVRIYLAHEVETLTKLDDGRWQITAENLTTKKTVEINSPFVFIGAGGGTLPLLEKSGIEEGRGYGGFPVSGQWLRCTNDDVIARHAAKVYGKAAVGAPPMSVPHLDTRVIDGKKVLLFGPYAGFSTRFLKNGSLLDLPASIKFDNILPMLKSGWDNLHLTKYLITQVTQSDDDRLQALREYFPLAQEEDWELAVAGQRVQVIKKDPVHGGVLEFGTELVASADGAMAALLGASPGASTAVSIMLNLLQKCFPQQMATSLWRERLQEMIPSYGKQLADDEALFIETTNRTATQLGLKIHVV
jgi:malate dehydrogenase (quinone)